MKDETWRFSPRVDGVQEAHARGSLSDRTDYSAVLRSAADGPLVLDLGEVRRISSVGVREWLHFVQALAATPHAHVVVRLAPSLVRQMNMIAGFSGALEVRSVCLPYYCDACGHEQTSVLVLSERGQNPIEATQVCASCGGRAEFDDLPGSYLDGVEGALG